MREFLASLGNEAKNHMAKHLIDDIFRLGDSFAVYTSRSIYGRIFSVIRIEINTREDMILEKALINILKRYNNFKKLNITKIYNERNKDEINVQIGLSVGRYNLLYRKIPIELNITDIATDIKTKRNGFSPKLYEISVMGNLDQKVQESFCNDLQMQTKILQREQLIEDRLICRTLYYDPNQYNEYYYHDDKRTKRTLDNFFLPIEQKKQLFQTVNEFIKGKEKYARMGVPWVLKIMLYSEPGLGKDTTADTIASVYNKKKLIVSANGYKDIPTILSGPWRDDIISNGVYVLSDIDKYAPLINETPVKLGKDSTKEVEDQREAFGKFLNILDGNASLPEGSIIIMSTNHIEKFSPTFLRSGRINLMMELKYVVPETFCNYVYHNFGKIISRDTKLVSDKLTISKLNEAIIFEKCDYDSFMKKFTV